MTFLWVQPQFIAGSCEFGADFGWNLKYKSNFLSKDDGRPAADQGWSIWYSIGLIFRWIRYRLNALFEVSLRSDKSRPNMGLWFRCCFAHTGGGASITGTPAGALKRIAPGGTGAFGTSPAKVKPVIAPSTSSISIAAMAP